MRVAVLWIVLLSHGCYAQLKTEIAFSLKERDLIPEGITYDSVSKHFYIGSIHKKKIVKVNAQGVVSDFVPSGQNGLQEVLGLKVDYAGRRLWVCNNTPAHDSVNRVSNIHVYDLRTGGVIKKYQLEGSKRHLFNDLVITSSGVVYITDSEGGAVYRINKEKDALEEFIRGGVLVYPNGIALSPDEQYILVSTGSVPGIVRIALPTKTIVPLHHYRFLIVGIDGLYRYRNTLIGVQNTTFPESVIRFYPAVDFSSIEKLELLSCYEPGFDSPTTGVIAGDYFYFIANSQLSQVVGNKGVIRNPDSLKEVLIMRTPLD